jgi:hypothetical protein
MRTRTSWVKRSIALLDSFAAELRFNPESRSFICLCRPQTSPGLAQLRLFHERAWSEDLSGWFVAL